MNLEEMYNITAYWAYALFSGICSSLNFEELLFGLIQPR